MAPRHVTEFVRQLTPMAVEIGDRYGIDPALIITQAAIESGWGQEVSGNNYFGVKSHGQPGGQTILTHEEIGGQKVPVYDSFRVYDSLANSMEDYARFLSTNPRYGDVFKSRDLDEQVKAIAESGYATDSNYPGLLRDVSRMVKREMGPMPPAQIPNVVASQVDTQRPIPPLPQPRPQRMEIHPFDPARNTPRANADGSYSTEVSRTVQLPDGSWANVPSLWWGSGSTSRDFSSMSDDQLASLAQRYEKQSGQQFPRFDSLSAAEAAARARSASGAGTTGVMTAQRMVQGTGQAPTSAASRAAPTMSATPRLAPAQDGVFAYTPPDMQPAQITPGMGSLTPDFFRPKPQVRLPELPPSNLASSRVVNTSIERANAAVDPGLQAALARRVAQPGMVETSMARAANAVDPALRRALEARNAVGVGLPPATRSVPSVPVGMNGVGQMPEFAQFLSQFGPIAKSVPGPNAPPKDQARLMPGMRDVAAITSVPPVRPAPPIQVVPAVATQLATARPVVGFPTPVSQRPAQMQAQRAIGFPTPANIRASMGMAQPPAPTMRVTVQGANSYSAPQPQTFAGTSSGRSYTAGQKYTMGGDTYVANPDGSFTNTRTGRRLAGSSGGQSSQRSSSGPAQSLV